MQKLLNESNTKIVSLQETIKSVVAEKDALDSKAKVLEEECDIYKVNWLFVLCKSVSFFSSDPLSVIL